MGIPSSNGIKQLARYKNGTKQLARYKNGEVGRAWTDQ